MRTFEHFGAINFGFFEMYDVSAQTRGGCPVRNFATRREGVNFFVIFADVFYGLLLTRNRK